MTAHEHQAQPVVAQRARSVAGHGHDIGDPGCMDVDDTTETDAMLAASAGLARDRLRTTRGATRVRMP